MPGPAGPKSTDDILNIPHPMQVLVLNPDDDAVMAFIEDLQRRLQPAKAEGPRGLGASQSVPDLAGRSGQDGDQAGDNGAALAAAHVRQQALTAALQAGETPFELRALEVVLDTVGLRGSLVMM